MAIIRSFVSVLGGFLTVAILSIGTDWILEKTGVFPAGADAEAFLPWMLMVALAYRTVITIGGGYLTAWLAPGHPMLHVLILGSLGTIVGAMGAIANWDKVTPGTEWYPVLLAALALPSVWLGGKLKTGRT